MDDESGDDLQHLQYAKMVISELFPDGQVDIIAISNTVIGLTG